MFSKEFMWPFRDIYLAMYLGIDFFFGEREQGQGRDCCAFRLWCAKGPSGDFHVCHPSVHMRCPIAVSRSIGICRLLVLLSRNDSVSALPRNTHKLSAIPSSTVSLQVFLCSINGLSALLQHLRMVFLPMSTRRHSTFPSSTHSLLALPCMFSQNSGASSQHSCAASDLYNIS